VVRTHSSTIGPRSPSGVADLDPVIAGARPARRVGDEIEDRRARASRSGSVRLGISRSQSVTLEASAQEIDAAVLERDER
jgi:hypothetical protein